VLAFLTDEDFNGDIVRGLRRRRPDLDLVRVQDVRLSGVADPAVLEWAAEHSRIILTHDKNTMTKYDYARVDAGLSMPGVCEVSRSASIGHVIEAVILLAECSRPGEWEGQVVFLPFPGR
jgi:hypothetical protein